MLIFPIKQKANKNFKKLENCSTFPPIVIEKIFILLSSWDQTLMEFYCIFYQQTLLKLYCVYLVWWVTSFLPSPPHFCHIYFIIKNFFSRIIVFHCANNLLFEKSKNTKEVVPTFSSWKALVELLLFSFPMCSSIH